MSTALAQAPPADATRLLYERHSSRIFGFCLSRLGSREEAEDAVQTTFMNAQRGLGRGVVPEYELAWLFKIAQNVCHNRHQSARRRGSVEATQDLDALQDVIASPERGAAVSLGELTRALGAIPNRQRQALLLREFQGYSYEEIAGELGVSVAAVETLLFRARRAVAQQLEQSGATPRRRSGAAATVVELFRWVFGGAAAPVKVAAVTVAVAATATLAVVPGLRDEQPAAPAAPLVTKAPVAVTPAAKTLSAEHASATIRHSLPQAAAPQVRAGDTTPLATPAAPVHVPPATPGNQPVPGAPKTVALPVRPPDLAVPSITVPEVSVPPVTVPAVTLPAVTLPDVQLPAVPELPKLP